jgi:MFS family permease
MSSVPAAPSHAIDHNALPNSTRALSLTMWWMFCCGAALLPMLPLYLKERGISDSTLALLMGVPALSSTLSSQVWGYLSDVYFTRTRLLLLQSFAGAFCAAIFPLVPPDPIWIGLVLFVHSACISSRISMFNALILASKGGEVNYGRIRVAGSFSFGVAVLALGYFSDFPRLNTDNKDKEIKEDYNDHQYLLLITITKEM